MHLHSKYNHNVLLLNLEAKRTLGIKATPIVTVDSKKIHVANTFYGQNMVSLSNLNIDFSEKLEPERMQNIKTPGLLLVC